MPATRLFAAAFAACLLATSAQAQVPVPAQSADASAAQEGVQLRWLDPVAFAPANAFAPPPAAGSVVEKQELARLHALIAAATPERIARARWDGEHEEPAAFNDATGRDLGTLPATMALLTIIQQEVERVAAAGKLYFARPRPYMIDASLPNCSKGKASKKSYPSGHAGFGWSIGWTLARLMPDRAPALLARAQDYAMSRELCGVHYPSDLEASHAMAVLAAEKMISDPRLSAQVAAARAELGAH
ncbi:phosphatase PAP2 family protein [Sphingobium aquiterrae]|uniref:phosphatase PAP2 family protein n=1 Tax=Sphingobium aquiterrae TaxID=2038656 RepID=UPI003019DB26